MVCGLCAWKTGGSWNVNLSHHYFLIKVFTKELCRNKRNTLWPLLFLVKSGVPVFSTGSLTAFSRFPLTVSCFNVHPSSISHHLILIRAVGFIRQEAAIHPGQDASPSKGIISIFHLIFMYTVQLFETNFVSSISNYDSCIDSCIGHVIFTPCDKGQTAFTCSSRTLSVVQQFYVLADHEQMLIVVSSEYND